MQVRVRVDRKTFKEISREIIDSDDEIDYDPLVHVWAERFLRENREEDKECQQ